MRATLARQLNILVPLKRTIDYTVKPRLVAGAVDANVKHSMNPFDEIAVEEALRLRAKAAKDGAEKVDRITAVTVGGAKSVETLRTALAMGADDAVHITLEDGTPSPEPLAVAKLLSALLKQASPAYDLVLLGKQAIDSDASQTAQILAGLQAWPQATFASAVELVDGAKRVRVTREIDGGLETVEGPLPMVVSTDLRLNEPRYATLPNIMKAKKKKLATMTPADLAVDVTPRLETVELTEPAKRVGGGKVASVAEMVEKMKAAGVV